MMLPNHGKTKTINDREQSLYDMTSPSIDGYISQNAHSLYQSERSQQVDPPWKRFQRSTDTPEQTMKRYQLYSSFGKVKTINTGGRIMTDYSSLSRTRSI